MGPTLGLIIGLILAFIGGLFYSKKTGQRSAEILDLTNKINANKDKLATQQKDADAKTKAYLDALKAYDPNFHSDDDSDGTPSA